MRRGGQTGERGRCATCGKDVTLRVPKGGDGSALVPVYHTDWTHYAGMWGWRRCAGVDRETKPNKTEGGQG